MYHQFKKSLSEKQKAFQHIKYAHQMCDYIQILETLQCEEIYISELEQCGNSYQKNVTE